MSLFASQIFLALNQLTFGRWTCEISCIVYWERCISMRSLPAHLCGESPIFAVQMANGIITGGVLCCELKQSIRWTVESPTLPLPVTWFRCCLGVIARSTLYAPQVPRWWKFTYAFNSLLTQTTKHTQNFFLVYMYVCTGGSAPPS